LAPGGSPRDDRPLARRPDGADRPLTPPIGEATRSRPRRSAGRITSLSFLPARFMGTQRRVVDKSHLSSPGLERLDSVQPRRSLVRDETETIAGQATTGVANEL
jgi:hypothetical protein